MNTKRYIADSYCFFLYKIKLELYLLKLLKKTGYHTIYKAHPDRLKELSNTILPYADEIETDKFEKVWKKSDSVLYTYTTTSTFGYAINCKIPIILVDLLNTNYNKKLKKVLQKRVSFIKDVNYKSFNGLSEETLKTAIYQSKEKEEYYFKNINKFNSLY